jgi:effector-binding domain-containing protein
MDRDMRVGIFSFVLAVLAGIAVYVTVNKGEQADKPVSPPLSEPVQSQTSGGLTPPAAPSPASPSAAANSQKSPLAPPPLDPGTPDEVVMRSHPALILRGQARWDDGYGALAQAFATLRQQSQRLGVKEAGYPLAVFVETDDQGFKYEAELPVDSLPAQRPADLAAELRFGATPEGKAIRFVHRGAYDEIDSTYEAVSAYVDVKGFEVKDTLIEEYIEMGQDSSDMAIEVHIFVQPTK